jgi:hypothetical protein
VAPVIRALLAVLLAAVTGCSAFDETDCANYQDHLTTYRLCLQDAHCRLTANEYHDYLWMLDHAKRVCHDYP